jgi:PiT family inorganic phosphate transporter
MDEVVFILTLTFILGLIFEFTNGFHDAANVVSTVIATKVMRPIVAIVMAACLNLFGATQVSDVAKTLTEGFINPHNSNQLIVLSALGGAIFWNLLTWYCAIPSSSSYALIGGIIGSGFIAFGKNGIMWHNFFDKVILPMIISPALGFFLSYGLLVLIRKMLKNKNEAASPRIFAKLQIGSAGLVALAHGFNDAQKTMAILTLGLFAANKVTSLEIPIWVVIICALVMALGTMFGGLRIVKTMGFKITKIRPIQGFVSETTSSLLIGAASFLGYPLSTTHMIVGTIGGVGAHHRIAWPVLKRILWAWVLTFPGSGGFAIICYHILNAIFS